MQSWSIPSSIADCVLADKSDRLAKMAERFYLPKDIIYLDGNSLGPAPLAAFSSIRKTIEQEWGDDLIKSWNIADWYKLPSRLGDELGGLLGAGPGQIVVCDSTTINIYKAVNAALQLRPERRTVISEAASFPTDLYILEGVVKNHKNALNYQLLDDINNLDFMLDEQVAVVLLSHVDYRTGRLHDMQAITNKVHAKGGVMIWDLCHSAGVIPIELDLLHVDFAVGCTYKYLNSGPGAPAYIYVNRKHQNLVEQPLSGWFGHSSPFSFTINYEPIQGIERFLCSTPSIIALRGVEAGIGANEGISLAQIRYKSQQLTGLFINRVSMMADKYDLTIVTPIDPDQRGSQVSIGFANGYPVIKALIERGVIGDFRQPNIMRFGFAPLYLSFADVWRACDILEECLEGKAWLNPAFCQQDAVT